MKNDSILNDYINYNTLAPIPSKKLEQLRIDYTGSEYLEMGHQHFNGIHNEPDYAKAVQYYTKAAEEGIADAYFALSICYKLGKGVPKDFNQAQNLFEKAAEMQNLSVCKAMGIQNISMLEENHEDVYFGEDYEIVSFDDD